MKTVIIVSTRCRGAGWRSGESTCLPPMWPGLDSQIWRHMWVEFVASALRGFLPVLRFPFFSKDLICVNFKFEFTVSSISAPALERLDT